jgi:hypothetical protein
MAGDTLTQWVKCVKKAKETNGATKAFGFVQGKVLKDAQKCYCAMI